jgi:hypothetical protein
MPGGGRRWPDRPPPQTVSSGTPGVLPGAPSSLQERNVPCAANLLRSP